VGKLTVRRVDGSTYEVRTTRKTRFVRLAHENPVHVDLTQLGDVPALSDLFLSTTTTLELLDLAAVAGQPAIESVTAHVARPFDLGPLARCPALRSVSFTIDDGVLDFTPLHGHPTLAGVSLDYAGMQPALDLGFTRALPALIDLQIAGGEWRSLDLEPLRGLPLRALTLIRQYLSKVDLELVAQPALEHLMLQDLELNESYLDLIALSRCVKLRFLSLLRAEVGTLDVGGLAKLAKLTRFDPPNFKSMTMAAALQPVVAPGLAAWSRNIGLD